MALVFEPTPTSPKSWTVRDDLTGEVIGSVEWLERLGAYGFGTLPGMATRTNPAMLGEIGRFLDEANVS